MLMMPKSGRRLFIDTVYSLALPCEHAIHGVIPYDTCKCSYNDTEELGNSKGKEKCADSVIRQRSKEARTIELKETNDCFFAPELGMRKRPGVIEQKVKDDRCFYSPSN